MDSRNITPDMARAELQRRAAARAELDRRQSQGGIGDTLSKIPGYAAGAALELPGKLWDITKQLPSTAKKIVTEPINSARDLAGGVARGSQNLAAALLEGGEFVTRKGAEELGRLLNNPVNVPKWNAREFMGLEGDNKIDLGSYLESKNPDPLLSGLGQYGLGGAAAGFKAIPMIGANAINSALQAPPGERTKAAVEGAVDVGLPIGVAKGANKLRPSKMLAGTLTPEQLQANLEAAQGTNTGLGDVIGSPGLKRLYENVLPRVPFSKADETMQNTATQLISKGNTHLENLSEGLPKGDLSKYLQDALKAASNEATENKNANYKKVNDIADDIGLKVERKNFKAKANEILQRINSTPDLKRELDPSFVADIQHYAKSETESLGTDATVKPNNKNLSTTNILKGKLNDKSNEHYANGRNFEYGLMKDLKDSLNTDIQNSIKNSGSEELKDAYSHAQKEYAINYAPFEDPDITKFTKKGGDADLMLSHFLRTGANDRSNLLAKVTSKLPEEASNLPAYMYLSRAIEDGQLNPLKMRTLYKNLGEKQRKTLIPDTSMRNAINKYTKSVGMNTEAFQTMFNPKTGQRVSDLIPTLGAMTGYSMAGGGVPGLMAGAAGIALPGLASRAATSLLTNPSIRDSLVKAIIKAKTKQKEGKI